MTTPQDVIKFADYLLTLNIHEIPDGSNWAVPITSWAQAYGYSYGDAWCSWTVSFIYMHVNPALIYNHPDGYSGYFRSMGQKYGLMVPGPVPGAIDVMDFDGKPDFTDHVGLVRSVNKDGSWVNFEGNHSNRYGLVTRQPGGGSHWFILPRYSMGPTPKPKPQEDDDMILAELGKAALVPSWADGANQKCYLDFSNQSNAVSKIRLSARRDTGDRTDPGFSNIWTKDILEEGSLRIEVGKDLKLLQGVTIKVEVLAGGPVLVTRKQTI